MRYPRPRRKKLRTRGTARAARSVGESHTGSIAGLDRSQVRVRVGAEHTFCFRLLRDGRKARRRAWFRATRRRTGDLDEYSKRVFRGFPRGRSSKRPLTSVQGVRHSCAKKAQTLQCSIPHCGFGICPLGTRFARAGAMAKKSATPRGCAEGSTKGGGFGGLCLDPERASTQVHYAYRNGGRQPFYAA